MAVLRTLFVIALGLAVTFAEVSDSESYDFEEESDNVDETAQMSKRLTQAGFSHETKMHAIEILQQLRVSTKHAAESRGLEADLEDDSGDDDNDNDEIAAEINHEIDEGEDDDDNAQFGDDSDAEIAVEPAQDTTGVARVSSDLRRIKKSLEENSKLSAKARQSAQDNIKHLEEDASVYPTLTGQRKLDMRQAMADRAHALRMQLEGQEEEEKSLEEEEDEDNDGGDSDEFGGHALEESDSDPGFTASVNVPATRPRFPQAGHTPTALQPDRAERRLEAEHHAEMDIDMLVHLVDRMQMSAGKREETLDNLKSMRADLKILAKGNNQRIKEALQERMKALKIEMKQSQPTASLEEEEEAPSEIAVPKESKVDKVSRDVAMLKKSIAHAALSHTMQLEALDNLAKIEKDAKALARDPHGHKASNLRRAMQLRMSALKDELQN